ncbi:MAG TPA: hypothetical protein VMD51_08310, partial [Mycobacterium sp.]|nr:hypothetical protein [Mycobacterium sp.]
FVDIAGDAAPTNWGTKTQTIAALFGGNAGAYAAFDPTTVITRHGRYFGVYGWFDIPGTPQSRHRHLTAAGIGAIALGAHDAAANPEGQDFAANSLCALASAHGIRCAVVTQPGRHDWPFAAQAFAAALPWLAGRLGTPEIPQAPLPGLTPEAVTFHAGSLRHGDRPTPPESSRRKMTTSYAECASSGPAAMSGCIRASTIS